MISRTSIILETPVLL